MLAIDEERREDPRITIRRPCKVYDPRSRKYVAGTTCNVSAGGMLLRLDRRIALEAGDRVFLAISHRRRDGFLSRGDMVEVSVARALAITTGETVLAVHFPAPADDVGLPLALAA
jgi:hypothetical protein